MCLACYQFAGRYKNTTGECGSCGRRQPLKRGYCRLCWVQAAIERPTGPGTPLVPYVRKVRHHQLFLAELSRRRAAPRRSRRRYGEKGRPRKPPPPAVTRPIEWRQLQLFDARREYRYGRVDLRHGEAPENPWLAWALHLAHTMAEARGFDPALRRVLNRNLVMLLADYRDGELIRRSDFHHVVRKRGAGLKHTSEILRQMGVLLDDRVPTFEAWLDRKLDALTPGIRQVTEGWVRALRDGGPRSRPRSPRTAMIYLEFALPALLDWSTRYAHLREVTRDDLLDHTATLRGQRRETTLVALRSLFAWAKKNGAIFRDPAAPIKVGRLEHPVWQPLRREEIDATIEAARTPHARLTVCLAAVHAARQGAIRALTLDDVDLGNQRLTIAGLERPLDDLTQRLLRQWLDYRQMRWPNTANQHLLITSHSALGHKPVSAPWINAVLRGLTTTIERLRIDRQLEEALTSGADPLHLAVVFDIDETTAIRYATSARQLLQDTHSARPPDSPLTQVSSPDKPTVEHLGSH